MRKGVCVWGRYFKTFEVREIEQYVDLSAFPT